jgi:hypothetical protein
MIFNYEELILINEALRDYKSILQKKLSSEISHSNLNIEQDNLILLNQLLVRLEIELLEEPEDVICDDCHKNIIQNEDIFIDRFSFKVARSMVVCIDCYENRYKELQYKNFK